MKASAEFIRARPYPGQERSASHSFGNSFLYLQQRRPAFVEAAAAGLSGGVIVLQSGRHWYYAAAILIGLGFVSSFFGKTMFRTPSLYSAVTLSPLTAAGSAKDRLNAPYSRSMR